MMEKASREGLEKSTGAAICCGSVTRWFELCANLPEQAWRLKRLVRVRESLIRKREIKYVGNE